MAVRHRYLANGLLHAAAGAHDESTGIGHAFVRHRFVAGLAEAERTNVGTMRLKRVLDASAAARART